LTETENLTKKLGGVTAVSGVTVRVEKARSSAFLGPNGADKTTTVRMLCCLISKIDGEAMLALFFVSTNKFRREEEILTKWNHPFQQCGKKFARARPGSSSPPASTCALWIGRGPRRSLRCP
jgi:ABC-type branched-subunit amino acid transport system ATPase component